MTIRRFEDLDVWQKAVELDSQISQRIHPILIEKRDFSLVDQVNRSSGSIADNITEGFERDGNREFIQFLSIAKGSCGELRSQLRRSTARGYISGEITEPHIQQCIEISRSLRAFSEYFRKTPIKGKKFQDASLL